MSSFNGNEGSPISLADASAATQAWREKYPDQLKANFIGRNRLEELLKQEGAMGIRIYYGLDSEGIMKPVLCAADAQEQDLLHLVMDNSSPCPPRCAVANPLNS